MSLSVKFLLIISVLLILPESQLLCASESKEPFSKIHIRFNVVKNFNQNIFHDFWKPGTGGEFILEMPFYEGDGQIGIQAYPFKGKSRLQPDFTNFYLFAGWGIEFNIVSALQWYNGFNFGICQMHFDDSKINDSQKLESELGAGINTQIDLNLNSLWTIQCGISYLYLFTKKPIEFTMIRAGITYTFDSPIWLREIFK